MTKTDRDPPAAKRDDQGAYGGRDAQADQRDALLLVPPLARIRAHHGDHFCAPLDRPAPAWKSIITYDLAMAAANKLLANALLDIIVLTESSPCVVNFYPK